MVPRSPRVPAAVPAAIVLMLTLAACTSGAGTATGPETTTAAPAGSGGPSSTAAPVATVPAGVGTSGSTAAPPTSPPPATVPTAPTTPTAPSGVRHVFPTTARPASYGDTHHDYPATDIFAACGSVAVAPVGGVIVHRRTTDTWDPATDNPALRGGLSIAVRGDDGVRYYLSHFSSLEPGLAVGSRVEAGQPLARVGRTGNARSVPCHIHFGLSPDCPAPEWSARRGVIPPKPYLDAWRAGREASPAAGIATWSAAHPTACTDAAADPHAAEAG